jgi:ribosome biogenesis GTPase
VEDLFADVERFAARCRFQDCRHEAEPGCGVKEAVERGELDAKRYSSFLKLRREAERLERCRASIPDLEAKQRDKKLSRMQKRFAKTHSKC